MPRVLVVVAALLALAGCVAEKPGDVPAEGGLDAMETGPAVDTGEAAMAKDVGHMPHMHDYWAGKDRAVLFDGTIEPPTGDPFLTLGGAPEGRLGAVMWNLPDGATIMEGSGNVEFTATFTDPLVTSVAMSYRIGPNGEWSEPIPLATGATVKVDVTPVMTDLPHQSTSRWTFLFFPAEAPGALLGPFDLRVEIVRLADIMLFPGHPELFGGLPEKVIHDLDHEHTEQSYAARAPQIVTDGGFQEKFIAPSQLVPIETKAMRIELDVLETSAAPGEVHEIRFFYRGADTSYIGHPTVLPLEGSLQEGRLVYQIPVAPEQTDTPYGDESQWLFFVEPATKFTGQAAEPTAGGMTDVSIKYHLKVTVYDHELETYSKMEGE